MYAVHVTYLQTKAWGRVLKWHSLRAGQQSKATYETPASGLPT